MGHNKVTKMLNLIVGFFLGVMALWIYLALAAKRRVPPPTKAKRKQPNAQGEKVEEPSVRYEFMGGGERRLIRHIALLINKYNEFLCYNTLCSNGSLDQHLVAEVTDGCKDDSRSCNAGTSR